jgi:uncharacterized membrane protein
MANCPNCGSEHIQIKRETNIDWDRTATGFVLFGVVGGAIGAVTGDDRNVNACLDCGTSWKAAELYGNLEFIQNLTNIKLDLVNRNDRLALNEIISKVASYQESIKDIKEQETRLIADINRNEDKNKVPTISKGTGCLAIGFFGAIFLFMAVSFGASAGSLGFVFICVILAGIARLLGKNTYTKDDEKTNDKIAKEYTEKRKEVSREYIEKTQITEKEFQKSILEFQKNYFLIEERDDECSN